MNSPRAVGGKARVKIVRRRLADGTVKEYRYSVRSAAKSKVPRIAPGSVDAMLEAFRNSPEWAELAPKTRQNYDIYLRPLYKIGRMPLAEVKRRHIITLRNGLAKGRGRGAATGFMRAVSAAWSWAMDNDLAEVNPAHRVKPLKRGTLPAWNEAVLAEAMARLPEVYRRAAVLAVYTAQRRGDLIAMTWSQYDGRCIRLRQQKDRSTEKPVLTIPVHASLKRELDAWKAEGRKATTILTNTRGQPWTPEHLSREFGRQVKALGLGRYTLHGLRKLAATRLAQAGCSVHEIAAIGGWRSLSMVQHYTKTVEQETMAQAAIVRLENARMENAENAS